MKVYVAVIVLTIFLNDSKQEKTRDGFYCTPVVTCIIYPYWILRKVLMGWNISHLWNHRWSNRNWENTITVVAEDIGVSAGSFHPMFLYISDLQVCQQSLFRKFFILIGRIGSWALLRSSWITEISSNVSLPYGFPLFPWRSTWGGFASRLDGVRKKNPEL